MFLLKGSCDSNFWNIQLILWNCIIKRRILEPPSKWWSFAIPVSAFMALTIYSSEWICIPSSWLDSMEYVLYDMRVCSPLLDLRNYVWCNYGSYFNLNIISICSQGAKWSYGHKYTNYTRWKQSDMPYQVSLMVNTIDSCSDIKVICFIKHLTHIMWGFFLKVLIASTKGDHAFVGMCLFVCLIVRLVANLYKNVWTDFDEILWEGQKWHWSTAQILEAISHHLDPGIFLWIPHRWE